MRRMTYEPRTDEQYFDRQPPTGIDAINNFEVTSLTSLFHHSVIYNFVPIIWTKTTPDSDNSSNLAKSQTASPAPDAKVEQRFDRKEVWADVLVIFLLDNDQAGFDISERGISSA